jgi:hypothetical protein
MEKDKNLKVLDRSMEKDRLGTGDGRDSVENAHPESLEDERRAYEKKGETIGIYDQVETSQFSTEPVTRKIGGYEIEIRHPLESEDWELERQRLQVNVVSQKGEEYYADLVTLGYIKGIMEEGFPELGNGNYFPGRDRIILKDLKESTVTQTLEDILLNWENRLGHYFKKIT